jgi:hypothetical protein
MVSLIRRTIFILLAGFTWSAIADTPLRIILEVEPTVDTVTAGDSAAFIGTVIDNMDVIHHEFDTCIHWSILPADSRSRLSTTAGSQVTFYAVEAYQRNFVTTIFTDPVSGRTLVSADTIYVKPGLDYREFIEPYPVNGLSSSSAPTDSIVLSPPKDTLKEIAAVLRDKYGNFLGFDSGVTWQELNDSGIIKVQTPNTPYVCRIESRKPGVTYVVCGRASLTIGTAKVIVRPGSPAPNPDIMKMRVINALTDKPVDSVVLTLGQNITLQLEGMLYPDSVTWVDIYGAWMFDPHIPSTDQLPLNYSFLTFNATDTGSWTLSILVPFAAQGVTVGPIHIRVVQNSKALGFIPKTSLMKKRFKLEYFDVRGCKLEPLFINHMSGVLFERMIASDGSSHVRKTIPEKAIGSNTARGVE